ncbi:MAG: DUF5677 domain-containing protein [Acidobacteriota bacterium]
MARGAGLEIEGATTVLRLTTALQSVGAARNGKGLDQNDQRYWALGFGVKLALHAASTLTLLRDGSALTAEATRSLDRTSVCVLARAAWEAFLLFHYIFVEPADEEDERRLRYLRWSIESPRARQHYEVLLPGQKEQLEEERVEIERYEEEIRSNPAFLRRNPEERAKFMKKGTGWRPGWNAIGESAGIAKLYRCVHYNYLCDHSHTGRFSVTNLTEPCSNEEASQPAENSTGILAVSLAGVIDGLFGLFPGSEKALSAAELELVRYWVAAGRSQDVGPQSADH